MQLPILGQGSQPPEEDKAVLDYLSLPQEMNTFSAPTTAAAFTPDVRAAEAVLTRLSVLLDQFGQRNAGATLPLDDLDRANRQFIDEFLGQGEVSIKLKANNPVRIQESVLAGVWRSQTHDALGKLLDDLLEVALIPDSICRDGFRDARRSIPTDWTELPDGVMNAPSLLAELNANLEGYNEGGDPHVINLSLLPQTEQDLAFLTQRLGEGHVTILSRGYGNCRISSTATKNVWWVQYFNSEDTLILNSLEICSVPIVACAAVQDIVDSRERLQEMLQSCA